MRWKIRFVDHLHLALPLAYSYWFRWSCVYGLGVTVHAEPTNRLTTSTEFIWLLRFPPSYVARQVSLNFGTVYDCAWLYSTPVYSVWPHESDVLIAFLSFARCGDVSAIFVYTCVSSHNLDQEPRHLAFSRLLAAVSPYVCSPCGYCMEIAS